jgi:inorganic pyrophosphatase
MLTIPTFSEPGVFHVVVESPRGSALKLKYDPRWNAMTVSRPLILGLTFPFDWGFVPSTTGADGDPLDALVLWDISSYPGVVLPCWAIGVLQVEQNRTNHDPSVRIRNDRILAVPTSVRREAALVSLDSLPLRIREELEQFTIASTALEGKDVRIIGWGDAKTALKLIDDAAPVTHDV